MQTDLSPETAVVLQELLQGHSSLLLKHKCLLIVANAEKSMEALLKGEGPEIQEALKSARGLGRRYARFIRETSIASAETQAFLLMGLLMNPQALMHVSDE